MAFQTMAQEAEGDSTYYQTFPQEITSRFYFSRKYTGLHLKDRSRRYDWNYQPNTTLNMGVGATYKNLTLNLAGGFGFLNPPKGKGDTRYFDLQAHAYPKHWVVDLFLQFYKGFHLEPEGTQAPVGENYYYRPDMRLTKIGASVQYLFNGEKFSYRAAFFQNEWQKKSAGSWLLGFEMYGGHARGDQSLFPQEENGIPIDFDALRFLEFGPNAGYAYTLVIKRHFFMTASASSNLGLGYNQMEGQEKSLKWGVNANYFLRGSVGYNSSKWAVNANYVYNRVRAVKHQGISPALMTGNYRLNFVYRFLPGPKLKRKLEVLDWENYL